MGVDAGARGQPRGVLVLQLGPQRDAPGLRLVEPKVRLAVERHRDVPDDLASQTQVQGDDQAVPLVAEVVELEESHRGIVPIMTTQCKFQVTNILPGYPNTDPDSLFKRVVFEPRYDQSVPEDQRFFKATPSGRMDIIVDNPQMLAELKVGDTVYITITKAV